MVRAGTSRGSLPQDEEVVMPPVALSETEHGMPRRFSAGSISFVGEFAPGDNGTPDRSAVLADAAGVPVCPYVEPRVAKRMLIARTKRRTIAFSC
jgi:hypothetical protein